MLQTIRNSSKKWAWIIVAIISLPFALWGVERFQTHDVDEVLTTVGSRDISRTIFSQSYFSNKRRLQEELGDSYETRVDESKLQQQVLQRLILSALVESYAEETGFAISNKMLADSIRSQSSFKDASGKFDIEKYKTFLNLNRLDPTAYEEQLRWQSISNQLTGAYIQSNFITNEEITAFKELSEHEREVSWVVLPWTQVTAEATVSEEEVVAAYEQNQQNFSVPEKMKVEYISLNVADLSDSVEVSDEDIEKYYDDNKEQFTKEESRRVKHILFGINDLENAEKILEQIKSGGDFELLAKAHSIDTVSSEDGGDLGFVNRGVMLLPFEQSAFSLGEGEISDLVETDFGYHIIKVEEIERAQIEPIEKVLDEVTENYRRDQALIKFSELQDILATNGFENPTSLEPASNATGLTIETSDWFSIGAGTDIAENRSIRDSAFTESVKNDGNNSNLIEISPEHFAILRMQEVKQAYVKPLTEVEEDIRSALYREKSTKILSDKANQDIQALRSQQVTWEEVLLKYQILAGSKSFTWIDGSPAVDNKLEDNVKEILFEMPRSYSPSQIQFNSAVSNTGNILLLANRNSRNPADIEESSEEVANLLLNFQEQNERISLLEYLQKKYDITHIDTSRL